MIGMLFTVVKSLFGVFRPRGDLLLENLALRHQLTVLTRNARRSRFSNPDRLFWALLRRIWSRWKGALVILQPQTVEGWHRAGFRKCTTWHNFPKKEARMVLRNSHLTTPRIRPNLLNTLPAGTRRKTRKALCSQSDYELESERV